MQEPVVADNDGTATGPSMSSLVSPLVQEHEEHANSLTIPEVVARTPALLRNASVQAIDNIIFGADKNSSSGKSKGKGKVKANLPKSKDIRTMLGAPLNRQNVDTAESSGSSSGISSQAMAQDKERHSGQGKNSSARGSGSKRTFANSNCAPHVSNEIHPSTSALLQRALRGNGNESASATKKHRSLNNTSSDSGADLALNFGVSEVLGQGSKQMATIQQSSAGGFRYRRSTFRELFLKGVAAGASIRTSPVISSDEMSSTSSSTALGNDRVNAQHGNKSTRHIDSADDDHDSCDSARQADS